MPDAELSFDGVPIEAFSIQDDQVPAVIRPNPSGATGIAESFLAEVVRAHRAVLDVHQTVSASLLAAAGAAVAHPPIPTSPQIPSPRSEIGASRASPARRQLRPRLPVGDMLMHGADLEFDGTPGEYRLGSSLLSEFPVPQDAWFGSEDRSTLRNLAWQEIALQAGVRLGTSIGLEAAYPETDLVCRNLEGRARLPHLRSPLGRTLRVRTELLDHTPLRRSLLLRIGFVVSLDGEPCYEGETVHGFFTPDALAGHQGLDAGRRVPTWLERQHRPAVIEVMPPACGESRLNLIDEVAVVPGGGEHSAGYALARKRIDPNAWYFEEHFPDDPVMPRSLGVEMLFHALNAYGVAAGLTDAMSGPSFVPAPGDDLTWKYQGQVLREHEQIQAEVHVRSVERRPDHALLHADGALYCDGLRIYRVDGIRLQLREGRRS